MTSRRSRKADSKRSQHRRHKARAVAGIFAAVGLAPMLTAPRAAADLDWWFDLFGSLDAPTTVVDSTQDWGDLSAWLDSIAWADPTSWAINTAPEAALGTALDGGWFEQYVYAPIHGAIDDWINSPEGIQVADWVNTWSGQFLIGDGAAGTAEHPDGGDGGLRFGDGGDGYYGGTGGKG
ncbi:hypothetical protein GWR20_20730, partial [Mycolicibacter kumamotonensis]|nr:hypothetical protein [Mycolicibacter kumamotonensis]